MPLPFPDDLTKGWSKLPRHGGLLVDFSPTIVGNKAGETIGFDSTYSAEDYPKAPEVIAFNMLYQSDDMEVKAMTLGAAADDMSVAQKYAGFSETPAREGEPISVRVAGVVYLPVGADGDVTAGELVAPCFDNSGDNVAGDIVTFFDPATDDTPATSGCHTASMIVGRAIKGGTARVDADNFDLALVVLRGY